MKFGLLSKAVVMLAATQSTLAIAAMSDADAQQTVQQAVRDDFSADAIVEMLVEDGRTLQQVGEVVVKASTGATQIDLARAAICAATSTEEAEDVGEKAIAQVGPGAAADQIEGIVEVYETTGCMAYADRLAPPSYAPSNTGTGGGTNLIIIGGSPGGIAGGTVPPGGGGNGTIPPGSPAN